MPESSLKCTLEICLEPKRLYLDQANDIVTWSFKVFAWSRETLFQVDFDLIEILTDNFILQSLPGNKVGIVQFQRRSWFLFSSLFASLSIPPCFWKKLFWSIIMTSNDLGYFVVNYLPLYIPEEIPDTNTIGHRYIVRQEIGQKDS